MPAQLTTKAQVNGYRFLLRRLDHALVRRDVRMLHDPMKSQSRSLMVGAVLGLIIVAGAAILGFLKPQGAIGDALIVTGKQSGAMYVVVEAEGGEKTLHPVLNLASARLIAGDAQAPKSVKDDKLGSLPRGPLLGIPGAPAALAGSRQGSSSNWTLCETTQLSAAGSVSGAGGLTTVIVGKPETGDRVGAVGADDAMLMRRDDKTFLVYRGTRAEVDPNNSVLARTLGLTGQQVRPIGSAVLGATTQAPPLTVPSIERAGEPGPGKLSNVPIGGIIAVTGVEATGQDTLYVVLADGVQRVSEFTADLLRNADSRGMREIAELAPDVLDRMPMLHTLPIDDFPEHKPRLLTAEDAPVACVNWAKNPGEATAQGKSVDGPAERATVTLLAGTKLPLADSAKPVTLATADGSGDRTDAVYLAPSTGEYVQVTGVEPGSLRRESLFYVADNGIRYGIPDAATAAVLGLGDKPRLAPWSIIGKLVPGPTLSAKDALTSYDSLPSASR
ncbi:MAG: type VII secretion protein EccB [Nocardia sp.]|nr:type VII secretion protein EccB [Nocardia sp.]